MKIGEIFKIKNFMIFVSDNPKVKYIILDEKTTKQDIGIFFKEDVEKQDLYFFTNKNNVIIRSRQGENNKNNHLIFEKIF